MLRMHTKILIPTCLIGLIVIVVIATRPSEVAPMVRQTTNVEAPSYVTILNGQFQSIARSSNGIAVSQNWKGKPTNFVYAVGQSFVRQDDHGHVEYTVVSVDDLGVVIDYFSRFNLRSLGTNEIHEDSGTFRLKWK